MMVGLQRREGDGGGVVEVTRKEGMKMMMMEMMMMMTTMIWERQVRENLTLGVINKQEAPIIKFSTNHCSFHVSKNPQTALAVWWMELWALLVCFVQVLSLLPLF